MIHRKKHLTQAGHHYLPRPIDDQRLSGSTGNYPRCQPAKEDPPAAEDHPSTGLGTCQAQSATNIELLIPQSFLCKHIL